MVSSSRESGAELVEARIFSTPKWPTAFNRAMLEYRSSVLSLRVSASSAAARSVSPLSEQHDAAAARASGWSSISAGTPSPN
jgi:hypothetical protein